MKKMIVSMALVAASFIFVSSSGAAVNPTVQYVQRTMKKLELSTAERPAEVRVLFYGQSITDQLWYRETMDILRHRYPTVKFEVENRAIPGFFSPLLIRTAESDLYPFYADIVFFNDYGDIGLVRKMIERLRERTTAEVVLWTSHIRRADDLAKIRRGEDERSQELFKIAADNHCMIVDLQRKWLAMLDREGRKPDYFLSDGVHMKGDPVVGSLRRYGEFIAEDLVYVPDSAADPMAGLITEHRFFPNVTEAWQTRTNRVDFAFEGNRVEAVFTDERLFWKASPTKVLLDGKEMRTMPELIYHDRASSIVSWMPMVLHVGAKTLPIEEEWTLTFLEGTQQEGKPVIYRVDGSVTGFDGIGTNTTDFVSRSGRVTIAADDFHTWQFDYFGVKDKQPHLLAKPGQWTFWRTRKSYTDRLGSFHLPNERVVLVSGCSNGRHVLTFLSAVLGRLPQIDHLTVYRPYNRSVEK